MNIQILNNSKKKKIMKLLNEQYGIEKLPHLFLQTGKGKYRVYSGNLSREEIALLAQNTHIEIIGSKICKIDNQKIRLNFDIVNLPEIKNQISENIIELTDKQAEKWIKGNNIEIKSSSNAPYLITKNKNNFLGSAQNAKTFIKNYVPKERRVRK